MGGPSVPTPKRARVAGACITSIPTTTISKFLSMFDDASVRECYRRSESIVPQQALALANSQLSLAMASKMNDHLDRELGKVPDAAFIRAAFETILASSPSREEQAECERALQETRPAIEGPAGGKLAAPRQPDPCPAKPQ